MTQSDTPSVDGLVLYADGSFRRRAGGWGVHGYTYTNSPLKAKIAGFKFLPTAEGYADVPLEQSVTPLRYIDAYGHIAQNSTNNVAELQAVIEAFAIAEDLGVSTLLVRTDSEYVCKNLARSVKRWAENGWLRHDGMPVANRELWQALVAAEQAWKAAGKSVRIEWVKGHDGEPGNELADLNALHGSGDVTVDRYVHYYDNPADYHLNGVEVNPLNLRVRMLFNLHESPREEGKPIRYYLYHLGRSQNYGHKPEDTLRERHNKTDLLFGRRIPDATFCVFQPTVEDPYLEQLMAYHRQAHRTDIEELAVARLDLAYRSDIYHRLRRMGYHGLVKVPSNQSLTSPRDDLISKTLSPPRMAYEAVEQFGTLERRLDAYLADELGEWVTKLDITDAFYSPATEEGKKKVKPKLHKHIANNTPLIEINAPFKNTEVVLKLVLGIDIPQRNPLAKLAEYNPKVHVLIVADGPYAYSFATVFETELGHAIYQSPYTKFILPH